MKIALVNLGLNKFQLAYKITFLLAFGLHFNSYFLNAQISPLYSKYLEYEQFINPAIAGRDKYPIVNISHQQYWIGVQDAPSSTGVGASMRLGAFDFYNPRKMLNKSDFYSSGRIGLGGLILQEKDGPLSSYCFSGSYAYFIPLNKSNTELSFGLSTQLLYYNIDQSMLNPLDHNDPELLKLNENHFIPETGCGIYYHDSQFYLGSSVNDLLLSRQPLNDDKNAPNKRDYFFQTGYKFFLKYFEMEPMIYTAKIDNNPLYYYGQMKFYYMNYNWLAIGYKSTESFLVSIGLNINRLYIAYVYEHSVSEMGTYFSGSHEIMLGINIGLYEPAGLESVPEVFYKKGFIFLKR